ncbi:DUF3293 domain-containing protein [Shewanella cyperi]|uniref:DUF3293 domain-containing protein n=1 Tax=Shewanella cyperi TaxID=2814292 RepID=UPI001A952872|nr:DUF3293 domain-containing protein [Shewanella cyperi]QSX42520.1 DUF3293 domain-containing protein [Shewanella cyperi]
MECQINHLWSLYQQTEFLLMQNISPAASFAIITAHNPRGELLSECQNRLRDRQLLADIEALGVPYRAMVGTSPDLQHKEKSWAVFMEAGDVLALAEKYQQNAIYYVEQDRLKLLPCLMPGPELQLGSFRSRARLIGSMTDFNC